MPDVAKYSRKKTIDHISLFGKANELDVRKMQFRCSKKSSMTGKMDKTKYNFFLLITTSGLMQVHQFCLRFFVKPFENRFHVPTYYHIIIDKYDRVLE